MNNDLNISKFLRAIDRKVIALIVVGLIATFTMQTFLIRPTDRNIKSAALENEALVTETESLEKRVDEILASGTGSINEISAKVTELERAIPTSVDDLVLTAELFRLAGQSVLLTSVDKSAVVAPKSKTGIGYELYDVTGTADIRAINNFMQQMVLTGNQIITVEMLKLTAPKPKQGNGQGFVDMPSVNNSPVAFTARLRVWYDASERLLAIETTGTGTVAPSTPAPSASPSSGRPATPAGTTPAPTNPTPASQPSGQTDQGLVPGQQVLPGQQQTN